jgi:hypothetical protein
MPQAASAARPVIEAIVASSLAEIADGGRCGPARAARTAASARSIVESGGVVGRSSRLIGGSRFWVDREPDCKSVTASQASVRSVALLSTSEHWLGVPL